VAVALGWCYSGSVQIAGAEFLVLFVGVWLVWIPFCIDFLILILLVILFLFLNDMCYCFWVNILVFCFQE
jgi:hypothetical protein